jgi:hypothetical protein
MGGNGSSRWHFHTKKDTVEDCRVLDANRLMREGVLGEGIHLWGSWTWRNTYTNERTSTVDFEVNTTNMPLPWVRLSYTFTRTQEHLDYRIRLQITSPYFGGTRWWLMCPLSIKGCPCGRRVGKLYLPPSSRYFGCRHCHDLTYESCQESHKYDGLYAHLAQSIPGATAGDIRREMAQRWKM